MQLTRPSSPSQWLADPTERLAPPLPTRTETPPTAVAARTLALDMRHSLQGMLERRLTGWLDGRDPICIQVSERAISRLNDILQPARRSAEVGSVSHVSYLPGERQWGLDVTAMCLILDPGNAAAWSITAQLLPDDQTVLWIQTPLERIGINRERAQAGLSRAICCGSGRVVAGLHVSPPEGSTLEELVQLDTGGPLGDDSGPDLAELLGATGLGDEPMSEEALMDFIRTELGVYGPA